MRHVDSIDAECKTVRNVPAVISRLKIQLELVPDRHQLALRDKCGPLRVTYLNAKFSAILLRGQRKSQNACRQKKKDCSLDETVRHLASTRR